MIQRIWVGTPSTFSTWTTSGEIRRTAAAQSADGKAAYVQVYLTGDQGEAQSIESVGAVRDIVAQTPAPPGVTGLCHRCHLR